MIKRLFCALAFVALATLASALPAQAQQNIYAQKAVIASGGSLSGEVDLQASRLFALIIPSVWTGTTTPITFQAGVPGSDGTCLTAAWTELYNDGGTEVQVSVAAVSTYIVFGTPPALYGIRCFKVRSGTAASPVTQSQQTSIILVALPQ